MNYVPYSKNKTITSSAATTRKMLEKELPQTVERKGKGRGSRLVEGDEFGRVNVNGRLIGSGKM